MLKSLRNYAKSPAVEGGIGLVLLVVGWKMNGAWANGALVSAWLMFSLAAHRTPIAGASFAKRMALKVGFVVVSGGTLYYFLWTAKTPPGNPDLRGVELELIIPATRRINDSRILITNKSRYMIGFREIRVIAHGIYGTSEMNLGRSIRIDGDSQITIQSTTIPLQVGDADSPPFLGVIEAAATIDCADVTVVMAYTIPDIDQNHLFTNQIRRVANKGDDRWYPKAILSERRFCRTPPN